MTPERLENWRKLCNEIRDYANLAAPGTILRYAHGYAVQGALMTDAEHISTQAIYIANNVKHIKGPKGKDFKQRLREFY